MYRTHGKDATPMQTTTQKESAAALMRRSRIRRVALRLRSTFATLALALTCVHEAECDGLMSIARVARAQMQFGQI